MKSTNEPLCWIPAGIGVAFGVTLGRATGDMALWLGVGLAIGGGVTALLYMVVTSSRRR